MSQTLQSAYKNVDNDLILKHVEDQYKLFVEMRNYLSSPWLFDEHRFMFHIDGKLRSEMLEKYYTFDAPVVREFIGKRLTEKMRPALNELSSKIGIINRSTVRQFENIRKIYLRATNPHATAQAAAETLGAHSDEFFSASHGSGGKDDGDVADDSSHHYPISVRSQDLLTDLMADFQLPKRLARKYCRIVYASVHQFELDKKKLSHLRYKDIDKIISFMIKYWGEISNDTRVVSSTTRNLPAEHHSGNTSVQQPLDSASYKSGNERRTPTSSPPNASVLTASPPIAIDSSRGSSLSLAYEDSLGHSSLEGTNGQLPFLSSSIGSTFSHPPPAATIIPQPSTFSWNPAPSEMYPMLTPHPKMISRLNHIKGLASSNKSEAGTLVDEIRQKLGDWTESNLASAAPDPSRQHRASSLLQYKFLKSFFTIGSSLGQSKEFKKIFSDILESIVQPCMDAKLTTNEIQELFRLVQVEGHSFISSTLGPNSKISSKKHLCEAWISYVAGLKRITLVLIAASSKQG